MSRETSYITVKRYQESLHKPVRRSIKCLHCSQFSGIFYAGSTTPGHAFYKCCLFDCGKFFEDIAPSSSFFMEA